jgi:hypothetical protein
MIRGAAPCPAQPSPARGTAHLTNGVDYAWLVGLVVSGLVHLLLSRSLDVAAEQSAIDASERELRAIDIVAEAATITEQGHPDAQAP